MNDQSELPTGLTIKGKSVRFEHGDRGYSMWTANGAEVWSGDGWKKFRALFEVQFLPTRPAAIEFACEKADLPSIGGRNLRIVKISESEFVVVNTTKTKRRKRYMIADGTFSIDLWDRWPTALSAYNAIIEFASREQPDYPGPPTAEEQASLSAFDPPKAECLDCGGTGGYTPAYVSGGEITGPDVCHTCGGSGSVEKTPAIAEWSEHGDREQEACPDCEGSRGVDEAWLVSLGKTPGATSFRIGDKLLLYQGCASGEELHWCFIVGSNPSRVPYAAGGLLLESREQLRQLCAAVGSDLFCADQLPPTAKQLRDMAASRRAKLDALDEYNPDYWACFTGDCPHQHANECLESLKIQVAELFAVIASAPAAAERGSGWRPISEAPKTRQSILVYCPGNQCIFVVSWQEWHPQGWHYFGGGCAELLQDPSHWQPLPAPPSQSEQPVRNEGEVNCG